MSTKSPHLTDAEIERFYELARQREAAVRAPRKAVVSARVSLAARQQVQALSRAAGTTPSRYLGRLLTMLADAGNIQPSAEQVKNLKAVCAALGVPADSPAETIKSALVALLDVAVVPEPSSAVDPLQQVADPPPVHLSRELAARGMSYEEFQTKRAAALIRDPKTPPTRRNPR